MFSVDLLESNLMVFLDFSYFLQPFSVGEFTSTGHGIESLFELLDFGFEFVFELLHLGLVSNFEFSLLVLESLLEKSFLDLELVLVVLFEQPDSLFVTVLLLLKLLL